MKCKHLKHLFTVLLLLCATMATAHDFVVGGIYYNILSEEDKTVEVTWSGTYYSSVADEYTGKVVIPESVVYNDVTYSVTSIGYGGAFAGCTGLTSVEIPNSVTSIGRSAFYNCSGLKSITIPNSVTVIGSSAFEGCSKLTSITIPNSITSIGDYAFYNCSGLTSIEIPSGVTSIRERTFCGCSGLTSVTISNSVTSIGTEAFAYCYGLTSIEIPNSVTSIGYMAFYCCTKLPSIVIPNSVTSIGDYAFCQCSSLTSIEIPNSVTSFGNYVFATCTGLTSVVIPNSVKSIGDYAFSGCSGLTSITIPNSVTSIGSSAFERCDGLTSIEIPNSVTSIGNRAFYDCDGLTSIEIPNSVTSIGNEAFYYCSGLTSVVIPNSVTSIGESAFNSCRSLTSIVIPNSVTSIGDYAFSSCSGLTSIEIPNSVTSIGSYAFRNCSGLTSIEIPNSVTSIGEYAFYYCTGLTSIEIPNSVTSIGSGAFSHCSGLTSIEIPNSVTRIGNSAFYYCSGLTSIVIPYSVTSIGNEAFYNCSGLKTVINLSNLKFSKGSSNYGYIAYYAQNVFSAPNCFKQDDYILFENESTMTLVGYFGDAAELILPAEYNGKSVTSIESYAFYKCTSLTNVVIPDSITSIGDRAFYGCTKLKTVINYSNLNIEIGSTSNGYIAYYAKKVINAPNGFIDSDFVWSENENGMTLAGYLGNATELTLPTDYNGNSVTSIGDRAFYNCSGLTSIEIPNSVTSIGSLAFYECTGLKEVHISDLAAWCNIDFDGIIANPLYYAKILYLNGEKVTNLVIPEGVKEIRKYAFSGCSGLTSIEIPNSVTSIGSSAFEDCSGLTSIEIPNSVTSIGGAAFRDCTGLTSIEIPNSVTSIGGSAFSYCSKLTSIEIPNSVTSIGEYAFYNCSGLTSIVIPNSVTSIGNSAFEYCTGLTSVTSLIPADKLFYVEYGTFGGVDKATCILYVPYGAKETYAATTGWKVFTNIVELEPITEVTVTINQYGSATYCSEHALDFSNVEGLKAYAATGYKSNSQVVTLTRVQTAEAGIGLFLKGEPGEYIVPVIESTDEHSLNMLVGTLKQTTVNSTDGAMSNYKFTIADGDAAPMFYPFEDNSPLSAGKAYLQIPTAWLPATAQKSLNIRFDEGETTDIDEVKGENGKLKGDGEVKTIYDLQGRVVENPTSGIYIINGKKVVVK